MPISVSFVLCCHNSAGRLPETLRHLAAVVSPPAVVWEVVVVDNASTDGTADLAGQLWRNLGAPAPLRVESEPELGLSFARWRGIRTARHEIVSFIDDDNWVSPGWLSVLNEIFTAHPDFGAAGGIGVPVFETKEPEWFRAIQNSYACGPQGPCSGEVPHRRGYLYGAGLSIRRQALSELEASGFRPKLVGRQGATLLAGEDGEICFALTLAGCRLWYDERLTFWHFMPAPRLSLDYALRLMNQMGRTSVVLDAYLVRIPESRSLLWRFGNRSAMIRLLFAFFRMRGQRQCSEQVRRLRQSFMAGRIAGIAQNKKLFRNIISRPLVTSNGLRKRY